MRVCYLAPGAALGGGERSLLDLIAALRDALPGYRPSLIVGEPGPLLERARALGVEVRQVELPAGLAGLGDSQLHGARGVGKLLGLARRGPSAALGGARFARGLRRALRELRPDLVHSNALKTHAFAPVCPAPVLWHLRDYLGQRRLARRLLAPLAGSASAGIAISRSLAADAARVLPELPLHVVYNAVDTAHFRPQGPRAELPGSEGVVALGIVATYGRWKGQDVFLEALARLPAELPAWRGYVIGGPIYRTAGSQWSRDELSERARRLGLSGAVEFLPFQADPAPAYRALDVVVHASTRPEPFGRTIVEAQACGRAVIAVRTGGSGELFRSGREALGIAPDDAGALAEALAALIADPQRRAALGAAGRAAALERFSRPRLGQDLARIYRATLA